MWLCKLAPKENVAYRETHDKHSMGCLGDWHGGYRSSHTAEVREAGHGCCDCSARASSPVSHNVPCGKGAGEIMHPSALSKALEAIRKAKAALIPQSFARFSTKLLDSGNAISPR